MRQSAVETRLRAAFASPLPGTRAHLLLAPSPRVGWKPGALPPGQRGAAALLLLYPKAGRCHVLLTVRRHDLPKHAGQLSLPGGTLEPGETVERAALREAREEVGVDPGRVELVGRLTPLHIPASGFVLHPVVGLTDPPPELQRRPEEVARILEIAVESFADEARYGWENRRFRGRRFRVPYFDAEGVKLWGATAMVVSELLWMLGRPPRPVDRGAPEPEAQR